MKANQIRNLQIIRMRQNGGTYASIGALFSITPARVRQICIEEDGRGARRRKFRQGKISGTLYNLQVICDQLQILLKPDL
jgi:hypothetical protein